MKIPIGTVALIDKFVMMNLSNGLLEVSDDTAGQSYIETKL